MLNLTDLPLTLMSLVIKHFISEYHQNTDPVKHEISCTKLFYIQWGSIMLKTHGFPSVKQGYSLAQNQITPLYNFSVATIRFYPNNLGKRQSQK